MLPINPDNVRLYVGRGKCCRCGCGGEYFSKAENPSHEKKVRHYIKKLLSGEYEITTDRGGIRNEHIYEIQLSKAGHDRVATFYVTKG